MGAIRGGRGVRQEPGVLRLPREAPDHTWNLVRIGPSDGAYKARSSQDRYFQPARRRVESRREEGVRAATLCSEGKASANYRTYRSGLEADLHVARTALGGRYSTAGLESGAAQ